MYVVYWIARSWADMAQTGSRNLYGCLVAITLVQHTDLVASQAPNSMQRYLSYMTGKTVSRYHCYWTLLIPLPVTF